MGKSASEGLSAANTLCTACSQKALQPCDS